MLSHTLTQENFIFSATVTVALEGDVWHNVIIVMIIVENVSYFLEE